MDTLVLCAKFEISENFQSDESKSRDQNLKVFGELTKAQQKMYDSKIETLEKQMVGMQQHFSQIVGQFSQKVDALIAENAKIRLETAARPPPSVNPPAPSVIQPVPATFPSMTSSPVPLRSTVATPPG